VLFASGSGLANATMQQRLAVRLFYDILVQEGVSESIPVGRGRYTPGRSFGGPARSLVARIVKLPWIPGEAAWLREAFRLGPIRNRLMLALAYDSALRRTHRGRALRLRAVGSALITLTAVSLVLPVETILTNWLAHTGPTVSILTPTSGRRKCSHSRLPIWSCFLRPSRMPVTRSSAYQA
jgi:hypothetical protein